jgi:hypothetical protein
MRTAATLPEILMDRVRRLVGSLDQIQLSSEQVRLIEEIRAYLAPREERLTDAHA